VSQEHDSKFFNVFSVVIGILVAITIGLFVIARIVGFDRQGQYVSTDGPVKAQIVDRIAPVGQVAVAGQDNSALAIKPDDPSKATVALALPADGAETYTQVCAGCHAAGVAGAPKSGDKGAWAARVAQGQETLYRHAIEGYKGAAGYMPAKGGRADLTDELVKQAVDHMVAL
jgi:cytochrome c5